MLRFLRDGETVFGLDADGNVRQEGETVAVVVGDELRSDEGELLATMPDDGPVRAADGSELPFFVSPDGQLLIEGQADPVSIDDNGVLRYPLIDGEVTIQGLDDTPSGVRLRRTALLLILYQSDFLSDRFRQYVRRAKALEARRNLQAIAEALTGRSEFPERLGPTPEDLSCDERPWPGDSGWEALNFSPTNVRFRYALERDGTTLTLSAEADLDCDGTAERFILEGQVSEDGYQQGTIEEQPPRTR